MTTKRPIPGYVYIIGSDHVLPGRYKVGMTETSDRNELINRYKTPLINPEIHYFAFCADAKTAETKSHAKLKCISDNNGKLTEWVENDVGTVTKVVEGKVAISNRQKQPTTNTQTEKKTKETKHKPRTTVAKNTTNVQKPKIQSAPRKQTTKKKPTNVPENAQPPTQQRSERPQSGRLAFGGGFGANTSIPQHNPGPFLSTITSGKQ